MTRRECGARVAPRPDDGTTSALDDTFVGAPGLGQAASTLGVAIAVPEPYGRVLQAHRASFGDPLAGSIPTHITLLPPIQRDAGPDVSAHLAEVASRTAPFGIHLRGTATFRPVSPVVFVQVVEGIGQCEVLERAVRRGPLERAVTFPYHPHVTVAHDLPQDAMDEAFAALSDFECRFEATALHLYEHGADGVWRPDRFFPFGRDA